MRLSAKQRQHIVTAIRSNLAEDARIWLFGSRADDARQGADVDLYIETDSTYPIISTLRCKLSIEESLDLHVDLLVDHQSEFKPIFQIARSTGVQL